ncbi:MAG: RtcB family protein [Nitrospinales bacterium]
MKTQNFNVINPEKGVPIKAWTKGVPLETEAKQQLLNVAKMPFIHKHVAVMPDVHWGMGATIGSVIPTLGAVIPAAVGVDIGCGMMAVQTTLKAEDLPENLKEVRSNIENAVPHGRTNNGRPGDRGAWGKIPDAQATAWKMMDEGLNAITEKHPKIGKRGLNHVNHLGTLGTGNHFIEVCLDESNRVWFMLHSGSRGIGNRIGTYFIELAKQDMKKWFINVPDKDLSYFPEKSDHFKEYVEAVEWAQNFARSNRELMMNAVIGAMRDAKGIPHFEADLKVVNCHHNYVSRENHFGKNVILTRKGAVRARLGDLGIIPGSMGAKSFIVRGLGNKDSFESCSHGAGRTMSRAAAKRKFTVEDHIKATEGVECRKDKSVIDETPAAYKAIEDVMEAQKDLVEVMHTLRQVVCVKG